MYNIKEKTKEMASFVIGISSDMFKEFDHDDEINFLNQALNLQELREFT